MLLGWLERYPIVSIEDPFAEDDARGLASLSPRPPERRVQIVGDDYLVPTRAHPDAASAAAPATPRCSSPTRSAPSPRPWPARRRAGRGLGRHRLGALGRDRGRVDRPPRGRLGRRAAQGRLLRALERMAKWNEGLRIEEALGSRVAAAFRVPMGKIGAGPFEAVGDCGAARFHRPDRGSIPLPRLVQ